MIQILKQWNFTSVDHNPYINLDFNVGISSYYILLLRGRGTKLDSVSTLEKLKDYNRRTARRREEEKKERKQAKATELKS